MSRPMKEVAAAQPAGTHQCGVCGAIYRVVYRRAPFPVSDAFNCQVCRRELASWVGCRVPDYSLLTPELHHAKAWRSPSDDEAAWHADGNAETAPTRRGSIDV